MNPNHSLNRSPELMSVGDTGLLVVDMQANLLPVISDRLRVEWNCRRLIDGATVLDMPVAATEQYPKGLGPTIESLASRLGPIPSKQRFSCIECGQLFESLEQQDIFRLLVCGVETHVCIQQTVIDLLAMGWRIYLAIDAMGSRFEIDHRTALDRMDSAGAVLTTTEAALFEWCETAAASSFKAISQLVREELPK